MSTRLLLKVPTPIARIGLGASVTTLGIILVLAARPFLGTTLGIAGLVIGLTRDVRFAIMFLATFSLFWCVIGLFYFYNVIGENDTRTFLEWTRDSWVVYALLAVNAVTLMLFLTEDSTASWSGLEQDYSDIGDWQPNGELLAIEGIGKIGGTEFELIVSPSNAGIVVGRKSGNSLLFRWEKIVELSTKDAQADRVFAKVSRNIPTPLELELPWEPKFWMEVPRDVYRNDT